MNKMETKLGNGEGKRVEIRRVGNKKELKCVMYRYKFPMVHVINTCDYTKNKVLRSNYATQLTLLLVP